MAKKKISDLSASAGIAGDDLFEIETSTPNSKKVTGLQILQFILANLDSPDSESAHIGLANDGISINFLDQSIVINASGIHLTGANIPLAYKALLSQDHANDPTITSNSGTPLINNFGADIVFARQSAGIYTGALTGAFPQNKTICSIGQFENVEFTIFRLSDDVIQIETRNVDASGNRTLSDGNLNFTSVEIEVYP